MIAVDTNLLVYAHRKDSVFHSAAVPVLKRLAEGDDTWSIPWACLHEFYSVVTHPKVYQPATTPEDAVKQIELWTASPTIQLLAEAPGYWSVLRDLATKSHIVDGMVYDARIAAVCIVNGVAELWSADRDFTRMPGLKVRNPLVC